MNLTNPSLQIASELPGFGGDCACMIKIDRNLNLKGKVCPYTFLESMLVLEEMENGQVLRVVLDYPQAVCDVPRSLSREGYEILAVNKINETDWEILVRNKAYEE